MIIHHILVLALIQGLTEFLPVSSSGHLVLVHDLLGGEQLERWREDLLLDIAVHVGTLLSVLVYFRKDVSAMFCGLLKVNAQASAPGRLLLVHVIIASVPVVAAGLLLHIWAPDWLRSVEIMAWSTLIFGIVLWWADRNPVTSRQISDITLRDALVIGCAQVLALVPGTSRSGITMTAGRFLGLSRTEAAHFSLLLAIIAIAGAGTIGLYQLWQSGFGELGYDVLLAAFLAFFSGWAAIAGMMAFLARASFMVFAVYRVLLGTALLGLIYTGFLT